MVEACTETMGPYHIARVVCPFGAMNFTIMDRRVFKCDLHDGDPQCIRFCEVKAVKYVDADRLSTSEKKVAAERITAAHRNGRRGIRMTLIGVGPAGSNRFSPA